MTADSPLTHSVMRGDWEPIDDIRCELGEGARFFGDLGIGADPFLVVNLPRGRLYSTTGQPGSGLNLRAELDKPLGAVAPYQREPGTWIAAAGEGISLLTEVNGRLSEERIVSSPAAELATGPEVSRRMNDAVVDPHGRFWAGVMAWEAEQGAGFQLRVDRDLTVTKVIDEMTIPNGPAFSADGRLMYLADTPTQQIRRYTVDPETSQISGGEVFVTVAEGNPDGMTVDAEGCLWNAVYGGGCVNRYSPAGELLESIPVPARQPTSVALSAEPPYRAVVTTAAQNLTSPQHHDGRVITAPIDVAGVVSASF